MLRIHFTPRDLARVTLATKPAPLWEVLLSLHMLQHSDGRLIFETALEPTRRAGASVHHEITQLGIWLLSGHGSGTTRQPHAQTSLTA